jgi:hypothetical protein
MTALHLCADVLAVLPPVLSKLYCPQDPFKRDTKLHSELGNVSRVWPSISQASRMSELRMRSTVSQSSMHSGMRMGSNASSEKGDMLGPMPQAHAHKPVSHLETVYSVEPTASEDLASGHAGKSA